LLDTTRAYAMGKLAQTDEPRAVARRHAAYYAARLAGLDQKATSSPGGVAVFAPHMGNIRAALEWSFSSEGEPAIGVRLAAGATPLFLGLALLVEWDCRQFWGVSAKGVFSRRFFDREWTRGLDCEGGEDRC
jgi:predicted ATPase